VFASYTVEFALHLRKSHGKTSLRVVEKCPDIPVAVVQYTFIHKQYTELNIITIKILKLTKEKLHNKKYITIKIHNNKNTYKMIKNVTKRI
jgi:hypothetical protein